MATKITPTAGLRRCSGSATFGIAAHEAPPAAFPVQPSRKDGLGTMCKPHWREYTRALGQARRARKAAEGTPPVVAQLVDAARAAGATVSVKRVPHRRPPSEPEPAHEHAYVGTKEWFLHPGHLDIVETCDCGAHGPATCPECFSSDADECATIRERSVAGTSDSIPDCPIHGAFQDAEPKRRTSSAKAAPGKVAKVRKAKALVDAIDALPGPEYVAAIGSDEAQAALEALAETQEPIATLG